MWNNPAKYEVLKQYLHSILDITASVYHISVVYQGASAWQKETAQTCVFILSLSFLLKRSELQSSNDKRSISKIPIGIFAYAINLATRKSTFQPKQTWK